MFKPLAIAAAVSLCNIPAHAADRYTIDSRHTFPSFEIDHMGFSTQRGRFDKTTGSIELDAAAGQGSVDIRVEAASISTGLAELEDRLRSADFFDAGQFPTVTFKSDRLTFTGEQLTGVDGILTMHGVSKPVHLDVEHFQCAMNPIRMKYACGANATTTLKRSDFGVSKYVPMIADQVKIAIQVEAFRD
ncbi:MULTISPECIES: YceI family protein [Methylomonas]|uniref:YceI family protein n=1 Tax=Methylomonas TaxID=416 RepID=UPI001231DC46|nr:YceI family protein [Methylomonas rhizoryzae]